MSEYTIGIALAVYAILLWLMLFYVWRRGYREWKENRANRLLKFPARVADRREQITSFAASGEPEAERFVTFEFKGRQQEFVVDEALYNELRIGRQGTIYLRAGKLETFEPSTESRQAEDIYQKMVGE